MECIPLKWKRETNEAKWDRQINPNWSEKTTAYKINIIFQPFLTKKKIYFQRPNSFLIQKHFIKCWTLFFSDQTPYAILKVPEDATTRDVIRQAVAKAGGLSNKSDHDYVLLEEVFWSFFLFFFLSLSSLFPLSLTFSFLLLSSFFHLVFKFIFFYLFSNVLFHFINLKN